MAARHFAGETLFSFKNFLRKAVAPLGRGEEIFKSWYGTRHLFPTTEAQVGTVLKMIAFCCSVHGNALNQAIGQTLIWRLPP